MTRCIVYTRISQDQAADQHGVINQLAAREKHAASRRWNVIARLADNDVSASSGADLKYVIEIFEKAGARLASVEGDLDGYTTNTVGIQPAGDRVPENATQQNPTFDLNYSQAWTCSTGVTVPQISIHLSARSGFPRYLNQTPGYLVSGASGSGGS